MENSPIENLMKSTMEQLKNMIDVDTIIGNPINAQDGSTILPISKLSLGFASGGSEYPQTKDTLINNKYPFGGAVGAGVSIKPIAFLVIRKDSQRLISLNNISPADKIIDGIPQVMDMINNFKNKKNKDENAKEDDKKDDDKKEDKKKKDKIIVIDEKDSK